MTPTCPKCGGTDLQIIQNPVHGMFVFCKTTGCYTFPVNTKGTNMKEPARVVKLRSGYYGVMLFDEFLVPLVDEGRMGAPSMNEVSAIGMAKKWNDAAKLWFEKQK